MNSVMSHKFSQVPTAEIQRSSFDRSHGYKTTFDADYLIPFYVDEALPGDTFNLRASLFVRLATPIKPVMDNMRLETTFWAVPYRLLWNNFAKMMGEQVNPGDSTSYIIPQVVSGGGDHGLGSLWDYFGLPPVDVYTHSAMWSRAYNLIYNQWFRDQNLQNSLVVDVDDGPDTASDYVLRRRGKQHDYFTSCLPWPQKGTAVTIPLGTTAPILVSGSTGTPGRILRASDHGLIDDAVLGTITGILKGGAAPLSALYDPNGTLYADLSTATAATINALRLASQVQRIYEHDARGGTRLTELVHAHFGVVSPDARMQRSEYLGGGSSPVNIHPVQQTSQGTGGAPTPQGNLAAFGTAASSGDGFTKSFTEHCIVIGLVNVRADLTYQQGLDRMWSRSTRFDHYWPDLANIGEQAVLKQELITAGAGGGTWDASVFGYQERWAEYRYKNSKLTGLFRSSATGTLDFWHLSQNLTYGAMDLDSTFIQSNTPVDRVIAVPSEPHFIFDSFISLTCARPMPVYSVPGIARF